MCNCDGLLWFGCKEIYGQMVRLTVPENINIHNLDGIRRSYIYVDPCIANEIITLWDHGIITTGCCCGHKIRSGYIGVDYASVDKMRKLKYIIDMDFLEHGASFIPKSGLNELNTKHYKHK